MKNGILFIALALLIFSCQKANNSSTTGSSSNETNSSGEGGSMAAMTIIGDHMFRIAAQTSIEVFDISADSTAKLVNIIESQQRGLETLFPFGNYLLVGTTSGMLIYDVTDAANPVFVSQYAHVVSCDPVVAQGNYAYVTLRTGTNCFRTINELDIVDLSDIQSPQLKKTVPMKNPHGLDADGDQLVIGEGDNGFKWFDITDPMNPKQLKFNTQVPCFDVISQGNRFIVVGKNGLFQFKYGNGTLEQLSVIPVSAH